ncbi:peroxisome biosynthesis protein [Pyricularia oryzae 70-15]|uniref:Peroxisomal ATPase PEX1 n=3 Tax=Pyricularia oryzae TaxID=318829 RepID=G4MQP9_PYRO7|nr:peroxisome biosynthesis protein [Pyricularia oryzae 70-15]EHA57336.1 peroxisome biosynthesis protein [Pyricularia oryzae 70-15]ELQ40607.1 peroxisome biosynthesis protein (PAS1/Peroxin-1) [Pyricularia oryzae Y34]KAI7923179.1 peroxisome biosynthesis protein [Pyricularia oryzae]KAI7924146.1 peroxisome biosynthesis protein [Pyricularia oryzae]
MAPRKNGHSTAAEISLVHLKNCLVNLPSALVNLLVNINAHAQNVVVELSWRSSDGSQKSSYLGWTGLPSKRKLAPIVTRDGIQGSRGSGGSREQEISLVEIDPTLANTLGLSDGQKITAMIHLEFPMAHTVHIEPLTPEDWEVIELHANFLELNMMSQVRALPNPAFAPPGGVPGSAAHPLALHVSPTSTASIRVASLEPAAGSDVPFVKIAPNAEVIVAPKERSKPSRPGKSSSKGGRSVDGASGKSSSSTVRRNRRSKSEERKPALYLRAMDRRYCEDWFDDVDEAGKELQEGLSVWVDRDLLFSKGFRGVKYVAVDLMRPSNIQAQPADGAEAQQKQSTRVVAMLCGWDDPPNGSTVALSTPLCASLDCQGIVGGVVKIEPAPTPFTVNTSAEKSDQPNTIRRIKVFPFLAAGSSPSAALTFGGESKAEKEDASKRLKLVYGGKDGKGLLQGPLTDGQVLGIYQGVQQIPGWEGGIIKFDPPPEAGQPTRESINWILGSQKPIPFDIQPGVPPPAGATHDDGLDEAESSDNILVGIDSLLKELKSHLTHLSSVLLTGALGSGKTSVGKSIANALKRDSFYHTTYFTCRSLTNDESRVATVRETLNRLFMNASWGARLGGKAIVILDDLDKLCPAETELQVGNDNGRSRQISEALCAIVKQYCAEDSGVVLLATAQAKESLHGVVIGGHVVREIVELKSPDKDARRKIMEAITKQGPLITDIATRDTPSDHSRPTTADGSAAEDEGAWMDGPSRSSQNGTNDRGDGYYLQPDLDFLDIAGRTDGYMPGDLLLLVTRARNAALSRSLEETAEDDHLNALGVPLGMQDFDEALKGFTPASLHNVSLQSSTIKFDSIGGLSETRRVLLETLQYPTKYAPIFAQCPLRLRSGLLLYGYPGCGKTLLASAVAGECGLNFISVKGPEILNKYIGASEKSVRDLFERASAAKPCVLFFDEFDSIAPKRGHDSTGVTDRVVNQLLTQMDGAEGLSGVYVLAATSRPDLIDPALLRPGRLDKSLICDFPNAEDRLDIIRALASKVKVGEEVLANEAELLELARRTEGFTGADLQALMSNSQLEAIHDVLGDHGAGVGASAGKGKYGGRKSAVAASGRGRANYVQFLYGEEQEARKPTGATTLSSEMAERAAIAAKLEAIKLAKKAAKASKAGRGAQPVNGVDDEGGEDKAKQDSGGAGEVVIGWSHITKALDETRPSISSEERARLERIYREFVVGRSGQMKDGQPSMEIGGRSSLM